jgi:hypothetical protein
MAVHLSNCLTVVPPVTSISDRLTLYGEQRNLQIRGRKRLLPLLEAVSTFYILASRSLSSDLKLPKMLVKYLI